MLSPKLDWSLANPKWAAEINPVLANPMTNMNNLTGVKLASGTNVISHGLGRTQQGWVITDIQSGAVIYRNAPFNNTTLSLHSDSTVTINLAVF